MPISNKLTKTQKEEIVRLAQQGYKTKVIAERYHVTPPTIYWHISQHKKKTNVPLPTRESVAPSQSVYGRPFIPTFTITSIPERAEQRLGDAKQNFNTQDFLLGAFLLYHGYPLIVVTFPIPGRAAFQFPFSESCQQAIQDFYQAKGSVEPKKFWQYVRQLKAKINDVQRYGNM